MTRVLWSAVAAVGAAGVLVAQAPQPPVNLRVLSTSDTTPPAVAFTAPAAGATVSGTVTLSATASDNVGVAGVQFLVDGTPIGAEDVAAPYSVSWNSAGAGNGSRTLQARARDAVANVTTAAVTVTVSNSTSGPQVTAISAPNSVAKFDKYEVTFNVTGTSASNLQMPYDAAPPPGIPSGWGITVDGEFSRDSFQTVYTIPAFHHQAFDYQVKQNRDWFGPLDQFSWKLRFAPPTEGAWQFRIRATDASGTFTSAPQSFSVTSSASPGFVRVSTRDPRYFEFDNGSMFTGLGYNGGIDWSNPVRTSATRFASMGTNGVALSRIWLTQSAIFGSAWNPWYGLRGDYGGYVPRTGLTPAGTPASVKMRLTYAEDGSGGKNTGYFEACRFVGGFQSVTAVKRSTTYHFTVYYTAFDITGPRNASFPNYGFVLKVQNPSSGTWHTNCYEPGSGNATGQVISPYRGSSSTQAVLEGDWSSGTNDFLPPFYLALENVNATNAANGRTPAVYVTRVEMREKLANGTLTGPQILAKPSMEHQTYFEQRFSHAFDRVVDLAAQNGVFLKVVILEKDEETLNWLAADGTLGSGANFFAGGRTMTQTRWLMQAWWRYLQARWGYSPAIHSWELLNEGDPSSTNHYILADELGKYMRRFAPNQHLVTTSFWHSLPATNFWRNASYPNVDYADLHAYISTSQTGDVNVASAKDAVVRARCGTDNTCFKNAMRTDAALYHLEHSLQSKDRSLGKPLVRGEAGLDAVSAQVEDANLARDTNGVWLHNLVWAQIDSGAMYDMYFWILNMRNRPGPDGSTANGLDEVYKPYRDFMAGVPLNNGNYVDLAPTVSRPNDVRVLGQKDGTNRRAHAWIQNRKHTWCAVVGGVSDCPTTWDNSPLSGTVTIGGFAASASYPVEWVYFDTTGNPTSATTSVTSNASGNIVLSLDAIPSSTTDAAVKIGSY
jgi:hypothetical protein